MTTSSSSTSGRAFGIVAVVTMLVGVLVAGYGLFLVPTSLLGGVHVAAIGLSLLLSGVFATEWSGKRFGLVPRHRRWLSLAFAVLAVFLLVAFLVLNLATFEHVESSS